MSNSFRAKTGMSQQNFCATFSISLGTLRHWEQGLRTPTFQTGRFFLSFLFTDLSKDYSM